MEGPIDGYVSLGRRVVHTPPVSPRRIPAQSKKPVRAVAYRNGMMPSYSYKAVNVEPDHIIRAAEIPNDPFFDLLWGMRNVGQDTDPSNGVDLGLPGADIRAEQAWNLWTGDPTFRIALIDSGIDYEHPDLKANIWTNPGEIPGNGIDDDRNGWVDDVHGYNFVDDTFDPMDDNGHGTHVGGTLGAVGNNGIGVAGVNWRCRIVALKILDQAGEGNLCDAIEAMDYVVANGIRVSNNSWGTGEFSQGLSDVIEESQAVGHLFVAAVGNLFGLNLDHFPIFPAAFDLPNIISVGAINARDQLSLFSNIGPKSVDLGAPGSFILSAGPAATYFFSSGTSMAAPHVTGVAALLMSRLPDLSWEDAKNRIMRTTRPLETLRERTVTGGIVNAVAAVGDCNLNGIFDEQDIASGSSPDCDANGLPDECEPDCDGNGINDDCDLIALTHADCNANGVPDVCDLAAGVSADCNETAVPDSCELATGFSQDLNQTGVPDECETCETVMDCDDGNPCTDELCTDLLCFSSFNENACDDGNDCTENDQCSAGLCAGRLRPTPECAPLFSIRATRINDVPLAGDRVDTVTVTRGDQVTAEVYVEQWHPERLIGYNARIAPASFTSGSTGSILPLVEPNRNAGAFIDQNRADFLFFNRPAITLMFNDTLNFYQYLSVALFEDDCASDANQPAYLGTLIVNVSETATGTFSLCLNENSNDASFLLDCPDGFHLPPSRFECLRIHVPLDEDDCAGGEDCNSNGLWDICDINAGTSKDCNRNDVPDACDLNDQTSLDCNGNGLPDECDIAGPTSRDCDRNGVPDECQPDCNQNDIADSCDIRSRNSADCNENGVPDECDIASGDSDDCDGQGNGIPDDCEADCNGNGVADSCDLSTGHSRDEDENTVPDECQRTRHVPSDFPTIQRAIDEANPGDLILLADGIYAGEGNKDLEFNGKILTVRSANGPSACIVDAEDAVGFRFRFGVTATTRLEGLTIRNGIVGIVVDGGASPIIRRCVLTDHEFYGIGAAPGSPTIEQCTITGCGGRGILLLWNSPATISRCVIVRNKGGGIFGRTSDTTIDSCLIANNAADSPGGGIRFFESNLVIRNSTIVGNAAPFNPAIETTEGNFRLTNSIVWGNISTFLRAYCEEPDCFPPAISLTRNASAEFFYNDIERGRSAVDDDDTPKLFWGPNNINLDPRFVLPCFEEECFELPTTNYRLTPDSPCIDASISGLNLVDRKLDLDGHPRTLCGLTDLGAYEYGLGDFDCDRIVDLLDIVRVGACLTGPDGGFYDDGCEAFDSEFDGDIDLQDLSVLFTIPLPLP